MKKIGIAKTDFESFDGYVFPEDMFEVPGYTRDLFEHTDILENYAAERVKEYAGEEVELYITENSTMILLAATLNQLLRQGAIVKQVMFRDHYDGEYRGVALECDKNYVKEEGVAGESECRLTESHPGESYPIYPMNRIPDDKLFDFKWLRDVAIERLAQFAGKHIRIYISGLKQTLVIVLNVAHELGISVTLMHYNKDTGGYFPQKITF